MKLTVILLLFLPSCFILLAPLQSNLPAVLSSGWSASFLANLTSLIPVVAFTPAWATTMLSVWQVLIFTPHWFHVVFESEGTKPLQACRCEHVPISVCSKAHIKIVQQFNCLTTEKCPHWHLFRLRKLTDANVCFCWDVFEWHKRNSVLFLQPLEYNSYRSSRASSRTSSARTSPVVRAVFVQQYWSCSINCMDLITRV